MNGHVQSNNGVDSFESLSELFRCFICMDRLNDARLCPHCSKMCCYKCIRKWITERRSQCPHCRASLHIYELINCRWVDDVTKQLDSLYSQRQTILGSNSGLSAPHSNGTGDSCSTHQERLSVFCVTCDLAICHLCALFDGTHEQHQFQPLEQIYSEHVKNIQAEMKKVKQQYLDLTLLFQNVERNVDSVKKAKEERVCELRNQVELMIARLESQLKAKLVNLMTQRTQLFQETELLAAVLGKVQSELDITPRAELISRSPELLAMLREVHRKPKPSFPVTPVAADFSSEIVPPYDSSTFRLEGFSHLREKADPVYSQPLHVGGLSWRLKVYPDGNGVVRGNYLSVFLELSAGLLEASKYEYRIQMIHQASQDPELSIVREFASHFEVGECWGYNRFFRLDSLASEGYWNSESDMLVLEFQVRAPSYQQKCRDQQWHIAQLEANQGQCLAQLAELKQKLAQLTSSEEHQEAGIPAPGNPSTQAAEQTSLEACVEEDGDGEGERGTGTDSEEQVGDAASEQALQMFQRSSSSRLRKSPTGASSSLELSTHNESEEDPDIQQQQQHPRDLRSKRLFAAIEQLRASSDEDREPDPDVNPSLLQSRCDGFDRLTQNECGWKSWANENASLSLRQHHKADFPGQRPRSGEPRLCETRWANRAFFRRLKRLSLETRTENDVDSDALSDGDPFSDRLSRPWMNRVNSLAMASTSGQQNADDQNNGLSQQPESNDRQAEPGKDVKSDTLLDPTCLPVESSSEYSTAALLPNGSPELETADVSLWRLCDRINRLQSEAEAVAKAIHGISASKATSTAVAECSNLQPGFETVENEPLSETDTESMET